MELTLKIWVPSAVGSDGFALAILRRSGSRRGMREDRGQRLPRKGSSRVLSAKVDYRSHFLALIRAIELHPFGSLLESPVCNEPYLVKNF
jgi:hypothetical protein